MPKLTSRSSPEIQIQRTLISTGMCRGWHTRIAAVVAIAGILIGVIAHAITPVAFGTFFLACAIGLLGEVPCILRTGEVRARRYSRGLQANQFLIIRRNESHLRFYFYVITYAVLGMFSLFAAGFTFIRLVTQYAG